jgi:valyl-tRNA synthetase
MLGDTAVAVNPKDKRYKDLIGRSVILPLVSREIKIIADAAVDMKFGSGAVKVTPAHDPNDYALGKKHKLEFINVMHADGRMNEFAGDYQGMDRFEAREAILEDLKEKGLLEKVEPHQLSAGHCYRCHTIIEPYLSKQWFVKMRPLAMPAIEAVKKGKIKFHPKRWTKVYLNWMENIQDWCISRQIWWGHRLPVYYCKNCLKQAGESMVNGQRSKVKAKTIGHRPSTIGQKGVIVSRVQPDKCPECGSADIYQDEDVLDTWFSSWLWPFATFGWPFDSPAENRGGLAQGKPLAPGSRIPNPDLGYFYPTSVLVTAPEIIFFWVARMVMAGYGFMGKEPFRDVYIHGTVRDAEGKKMSKSLGNIIDPLEIIAEYGADALRFSLISITAQGQDVYLSRERFEQGRNFCNKLWNASRFILMNLKGEEAKADLCVFFKDNALSLPNRWVLSRFYSTLKAVNKDLENFKFNEAANCLYSFFWHEFCDWYLEAIKPDIARKENQLVMYKVLEKSLRVLHPFMPFITEEIWQRLRDFSPSTIHHPPSKSIMTEPWPHLQEQLIDKQAEREAAAVFEVITSIRNMRAELGLPAQEALEAKAYAPGQRQRELLRQAQALIVSLSGLKGFSVEERYAKKPGEFVAVLRQMHIVIPLSAADTEKQKLRLRQRIAEASANIGRKEKMLANPAFIQKAPPEVVEAERRKLKELKEMLTKLKGTYDACE